MFETTFTLLVVSRFVWVRPQFTGPQIEVLFDAKNDTLNIPMRPQFTGPQIEVLFGAKNDTLSIKSVFCSSSDERVGVCVSSAELSLAEETAKDGGDKSS